MTKGMSPKNGPNDLIIHGTDYFLTTEIETEKVQFDIHPTFDL